MIEDRVVDDENAEGNEQVVNVERLNDVVQLQNLVIEVVEEKVVAAEKEKNAIDEVRHGAKEEHETVQAEITSELRQAEQFDHELASKVRVAKQGVNLR